jgi:hypothetical protein
VVNYILSVESANCSGFREMLVSVIMATVSLRIRSELQGAAAAMTVSETDLL